ncbi:Retrotransposon-derived protein PEG10 [Rhizoctonia solani]|uniref:Retrotransposon-derived protein PEG10 n=1 Tax=Rhizoctonia solani TaxID=456999 RepID=A0A8H8P656_9AGAM|nr:Retrotransposon-derived protein PEG10 [Rhizoctonia solani]QRW25042.1 Retrotransposon-derived protein PEG10 [Rhizoctonia solani]
MATHSWPPSQACSPVDQGQLGPKFPPASPELGKISLKQVIRLLWGLQTQVDHIKQTLLEQNEINQEVCTNVENISQTVNVVKDGLAQLQLTWGPHTPEDQKPPAVEETPWAAPKAKPIGKALPFLGAPAPIISTGAPRRKPLTLFNPYPSSSFPSGPAPAAPTAPPAAPQATPAPPPAPSTVKVDHPDAFKGKIGLEAKQWLTRMLAWVCLNQRQFPLDLEVLSFLLMNMTEAAGAWAHPHLDQLGSHRALIQTVDEFKIEFLAAFGNPDATRAVERKITSLTQTSTCAKYITKFRTLQMELNWNNAALRSQFARGLHWEVQRQIATRERQPCTLRELQDASLIIDNALRKERASHPQQGSKPGKTSNTPNQGANTGQQATKTSPLSSNPNYVLEEERNCRHAEGLCIKCGKPGHRFAKCQTRWKATPKEDKGKAKETAKLGKDSEYQLGKE